MRVLQMPRRSGKTYRLVTESARSGGYIICRDKKEATRIFQMAQDRNLNIPFPLTYSEFANRRYYGKGIKEFLIDELDDFLRYMTEGVKVSYATYTPE